MARHEPWRKPNHFMIDKNVVKTLVNKWLEENSEKEYFLVDVQLDDDNKVVVEIDHKDGVVIDDCVSLSEFINDNLDQTRKTTNLRWVPRDLDSLSRSRSSMSSTSARKSRSWTRTIRN